MKKLDYIGSTLCDEQAKIFVLSHDLDCSSKIFIRKFMKSKLALEIDNTLSTSTIVDSELAYRNMIKESDFSYGVEKFSESELNWIGYIYRYICYTREIKSKELYSLANASKMHELFFIYHTMDPEKIANHILGDYKTVKEKAIKEKLKEEFFKDKEFWDYIKDSKQKGPFHSLEQLEEFIENLSKNK